MRATWGSDSRQSIMAALFHIFQHFSNVSSAKIMCVIVKHTSYTLNICIYRNINKVLGAILYQYEACVFICFKHYSVLYPAEIFI